MTQIEIDITRDMINGWKTEPKETGVGPHQGQVWTRYKTLMDVCLTLIDEIEENRAYIHGLKGGSR